jgi:hypothetical protein
MMSDLDYENTIAYLDGRIEELEAELQTAHEIGARHARRVGEQAIELKALRKALETLAKTTNTPVLQPLHQIAKAALLKEGGDGR